MNVQLPDMDTNSNKKRLIASFYLDYEARSVCRGNLTELYHILNMGVEDCGGFIVDHIGEEIFFKLDRNISEVGKAKEIFERYFVDRNLAIPSTYDPSRHIHLSYYRIFRIIFWIEYNNDIPFETIHDKLYSEFLFKRIGETPTEYTFSGSNISIIATDLIDYDNHTKMEPIWMKFDP